jgi:cobalt-zinc-cadmium efflux system outer membrane protein
MHKNYATSVALLALGVFTCAESSAFGGDPPRWIAEILRPPGSNIPRFTAPGKTSRAKPTARKFRDPAFRLAHDEEMQVNPQPLPPSGGMPGSLESGRSISLETALYGAITGNPDLVALRNSNIASPEAVEVARRFPTTLNPTIWLDIRPWVWTPLPQGGYKAVQAYILISYRQPIELGHQTRYRYEIARAALNQQQWTVMQLELLTMVQTYRFFQTAEYRRERLRVAQSLADFNEQLVAALRRRLDANQVSPSDVVLAEVENEATRQAVDAARQDYVIALTDLRNQIGRPETAGNVEPLGEFVLPRNIPEIDDQALVDLAMMSRPEIMVARAQVDGARAAIKLARGDMIPTPVVGPEYVRDEMGLQYAGFIVVAPLPIVNTGKPLVIQREAEYCRAVEAMHQIEQRTAAQVKAAVAKWNGANKLVARTEGLTESLREQVKRMEQLFENNASDLTKLLQTRQRLIQLENAELDALWNATQAQADLLTAMGAPHLIAALLEPAPGPGAQPPPGPAPGPAMAPAPPPPSGAAPALEPVR